MTPTRKGSDNWLEQITEPEQASGGRRIKTAVKWAAWGGVMSQPLIARLSHRSEINDGMDICTYWAAAVDAALPMDSPIPKSPGMNVE